MERTLQGLLFILTVSGTAVASISDLRLCGDPACKEPIAKGVTLIGYPSNDKDILSFSNNADVIIYSKEAGTRRDLWGVEIKGKRGYVPKEYVREKKILKAKLEFEVPTEAYNQKHKQNLSNEELPNKETETKPERSSDELSNQEHIAITAEDVEYNNLNVLDSKEEHHSEGKDKEELQLVAKTHEGGLEPGDSKINGEFIAVEESELSKAEDIDNETQDGVSDGEISDDEISDEITVDQEGTDNTEQENTIQEEAHYKLEDLQTTDSSAKEDSLEPSAVSETIEIAATYSEPNSQSSVQLESSSVDYEVIHGTTIYYNEDIEATPTLPEVQTTLVPQASSLVEEKYVTVDLLSILPQSSMETLEHDRNNNPAEEFDAKDSKILDLATPAEVLENVVKSSVIVSIPQLPTDEIQEKAAQLETEPPTAPDLAKLLLPPDSTHEEQDLSDNDEVNNTNDNHAEEEAFVTPAAPIIETYTEFTEPITEPTSEPTSKTAIDETKQVEKEFGVPKSESVLESSIEKAELAETGGFFSSWFGSSEKTENEDDSEISDDDEEEETETDRVSNESYIVESTKASENNRANDAATDVEASVKIVSSDSVNVPVDESKNSKNDQVPYYAQDVGTVAIDTQEPTPSSVASRPETAASSITKQYSETLQPPADLTLDHSHLGGGTEGDANITDEGEADPGPSTARPLFAEPEPTAPTYSPHANVDSDEMAYLTDKTDEIITANDGDEMINTAVGSLTEKFLKTSHNLLVSLTGALQLPEGLAFGVEAELAEPEMSSGVVVFLGMVVATIITIYLIHLIMVKLSRETPMLEALNKTELENRLIIAENTTLHEQLCVARSELEGVSSRVTQSNGDITELDSQLQLIKGEHAAEKALLEEKVVQLEHELEEATTNGMEMHKMLSEMLSAQKDTSTFQASVDHLQEMLDGQREKVDTLNNDLALKTRLNEELHSELSTARQCVTKLDAQVQQLTQSLKEFSSAKEEMSSKIKIESMMVKDLKEVNNSLTQQTLDHDANVSSLTSKLKALQDTIVQLRDSVEIKDSELQVTKECLKQLRLTSDDDLAAPDEEKLCSLLDVIRVKAELQRVKNERNSFEDQLYEAEIAQKNLEDTMSSIRVEVTQLRTNHDDAKQEKQEALSKLAVLTKYFEEKEAQLTKELESQEGLRVDAEGAAAAGASKIHNYGLELSTYKAQVISLRKELEDQENSYKVQISSHEQKAHDNWLQARSAERRFEEQRQENSQLRIRLTVMQKDREDTHLHPVISKPPPKRVDANGSVSSPGPLVEGEVEGNHHDVDSSPVVSHPLHAPPPMLPMMFPPGAPLPPVPPHGLPPGVPPHPGLPHGVPPPHGLPHGVPPPHGLPHGVPPPHGLPHGVPPPHGLPPPPFLSGEAPFMGHPLHPLPGDRRMPPAGGMSSPPFRRSGSPSYDHRNDRYSPASEHSHFSDRHYSPPPLRHRPGSPDLHRRNHSPDRRSDRTRSPDHRSDHMRSPDRRSNRRTPDRRLDRRSPERHFPTRSPDGYSRHRSSPHHYFDHSDFNSDESRIHSSHMKGKKTSTPLTSSDRWKNDS